MYKQLRFPHILNIVPFIGILAAGSAAGQSVITTVAGNGNAAYSGDGGAAISAALNLPKGLAVAADGTLYIADTGNSRIRTVNGAGVITTIAGNGVSGYSGDGGAATNASFSNVMAVALGPGGVLYIADTSNRRVRKVVAGTVTTVAGIGVEGFSGDGGPATAAALGQPVALALDAAGNLYISDTSNQRIRRIDTNGIITSIAGNGVNAFAGDGGTATSASLSFVLGLAVDPAGNIYIADTGNNRVRRITPAGIITTIAGTGAGAFSGDGGAATSAALNLPSDVAVDSAGNIYIADAGNNRIRKVDGSGIISTIAGTSVNGFSGDGGPASQAVLNYPWGLALDAFGDLYIADRVNDRIRLISGGTLPQPSVSANGIVNAASFASGAAVAPGGIVAIFGSNLAGGGASATITPLPTTIGQTSVTFNGTAAPLFYVSPAQINAQVPFDLALGTATIQVTRGSSTSTAATVAITTESPGIFLVDPTNNIGAIVHSNGTVVSSTAPANAGETILVYATGLGPLTPPVASGAPGPSTNPLPQTTTRPIVTIGGASAVVSYSGLAPTFVGLYQLNVQVPTGLGTGNQSIQLSMGTYTSNTATLAVTQ